MGVMVTVGRCECAVCCEQCGAQQCGVQQVEMSVERAVQAECG